MSHNSHLNNLGEQISSALNDALTTGDYRELQVLVSDTASSALNEAGAIASKAWQQKNEWKKYQDEKNKQLREEQARRENIQKQKNAMLELQRSRKDGLMVKVDNNGLVAGVLFIVFGAIANVPLFILTLIALGSGWGSTSTLFGFLLISIFFICRGKRKIQLINKAKRYAKLCGNKMYAEVEALATQVGKSPNKVSRELRQILQKGIIPTAHLDKKGTHFMLNDVVYKQYVDAENARTLREKEAREVVSNERQRLKESAKLEKEQSKTELEQIIEEGQNCIQRLRYMNDLIPGEVISAKLKQLENLLKEIFLKLEKEAVQTKRMHKVMNYYLPTTLKLVEAYYEFDVVSSPSEQIISAKKEIEDTLDTINEAFVELLNGLFQDKVMDITTDAQVLQTMLANEGLTKNRI